jgi:hypothetical protein
MARSTKIEFEESSGNVFADLGLPNAGELKTKLRLCMAINILEQRKLTQTEAAKVLGGEPAEGVGAEGVQAGGVFGGAANAVRDRAWAGCGDRDSSAGES